MPNEITLPFGALEVLPGRQGIEDVTIRIPTLDEIIAAIQRETLDRTDIDEALVEAIGDGIDVTDDVVADIVREFEDALGVDVPGDGSFIDALARQIEDAIDLSDLDLPGAGQIDDIIRQVITEELDLDGDGQIGINFSGVYGPLSEDIAEVLEDILNFDPDDLVSEIVREVEETLGIDVPGEGSLIDQIERAVEDALDPSEWIDILSPEIEGVYFWREPIRFTARLVERGIDDAVDDDLARQLNEAVREGR